MNTAELLPWLRIKPDALRPVKLALLGAIGLVQALVCPPPTAWATDQVVQAGTHDVADIEARSYDVRVEKKSASNRVFVLESNPETIPPVGKILLLKRGEDPSLGLRVLKAYPEKNQFAAKIMRSYPYSPEPANIGIGDIFLALEKVSDIIAPAPTMQDQADLKELEAGLPPEEPPTPSPPLPERQEEQEPQEKQAQQQQQEDEPVIETPVEPENADQPEEPEEKDDGASESADDSLAVDEIEDLDPYRNWLTLGGGIHTNAGQRFNGFDIAYGRTVGKSLFQKDASLQDSLVTEMRLSLYNTSGQVATSGTIDAYRIIMSAGTFRYNLTFSNQIALFGYVGLAYNYATVTAQSTSNGADEYNRAIELSGLIPAVGAGLIFRVGPNWDARVDAGYDVVSLGLMLRF